MEGGAVSAIDYRSLCAYIKGHTQSDTAKGIIPRAVDKVFTVADDLRSKGWEYKMEGQFLEIVSQHHLFYLSFLVIFIT